MADDTLTVEAAKRDLLIEVAECVERAYRRIAKDDGRRTVERIDALIAAVRAENTEHLNTCEIHADVPGIAYRTGCAMCLTEAIKKLEGR